MRREGEKSFLAFLIPLTSSVSAVPKVNSILMISGVVAEQLGRHSQLPVLRGDNAASCKKTKKKGTKKKKENTVLTEPN